MHYIVSDNPYADFDAYDRAQWELEQNAPRCPRCEAVLDENDIYEIDGERICSECLDALYTPHRGLAYAEEWKREFVESEFPECTLTLEAVRALWRVISAELRNDILVGRNSAGVRRLKEFALLNMEDWIKWLEQNI